MEVTLKVRCPICNADMTKCLATRTYETYIRRRRECSACASRWTTYECVEVEAEVVEPSEKISKEVWCVETGEQFPSATAAAEADEAKAWVIGKAARKPGMVVAGKTWSKSKPASNYAIERFDHSWSQTKKDEWFARHQQLMAQWQDSFAV